MKVNSQISLLLMVLIALMISTIFIPSQLTENDWSVYLHLRLPKYGMAFLAGGSLAVAGYLTQLIIQNPLAEPYVLGISGGAGVSVNLALILGLPTTFSFLFLPFFYALIGSVLVSFLLFFILKKFINDNASLLLVGLAINFFSSACISLFIYLAPDSNLIRDISFWFMGSYNKVSYNEFLFIGTTIFLIMTLLQLFHQKVYRLHIGIKRLEELKLGSKKILFPPMIFIVLLTSLIVSTCGPIGFIGLIIPYLVRAKTLNSKFLFPVTFLIGGIFTLSAELISSLLLPQSLPPGIFCAMFGIPVFVYLLTKKYSVRL